MPTRDAPTLAGPYELFEAIASGGTATVHLGRLIGPHGFSRPVAIKRLHAQPAGDRSFVAELREEARLVSRIQHLNVAPILDVVEDGDGVALVMDYVEGESLGSLVRATLESSGQPPPVAVVSAVVADVLRGLHAAHEATANGEPLGIVHRDVSPQNIVVGKDGNARIVDFGIAKAIGRLVETTTHGAIKGKLPYMAPEQFRPGAVLTRRTDIYGAGVVLWEALTGTHLFDAEDVRLTSSSRPKVRPPSEISPNVPSTLDQVVLQALSVDPAARFPTADAMARAIEGALPLASVNDVAQWVHEIAGEALERHAARLRALERTEPSVQGRDPGAPPEEDGTVSALTRPEAQPTTRRWVLVVGIGAMLVGTSAMLIHRAPKDATTQVRVSDLAGQVNTDAGGVANIASADIAPASPSSEPEIARSASDAPATTGKPQTVSPRGAVKTVDCQKPYHVKNGVKIFRAECLRLTERSER
jgi:eukaryotic-like serine/threonine-protein kinase